VVEADLALPAHAAVVLAMLDAYSADAMGDGHPLSADARRMSSRGCGRIRRRWCSSHFTRVHLRGSRRVSSASRRLPRSADQCA